MDAAVNADVYGGEDEVDAVDEAGHGTLDEVCVYGVLYDDSVSFSGNY